MSSYFENWSKMEQLINYFQTWIVVIGSTRNKVFSFNECEAYSTINSYITKGLYELRPSI